MLRKKNWQPVLPAGQCIKYAENQMPYITIFFEIMSCTHKEANVFDIPSGNYTCVSFNYVENIDLNTLINFSFGTESKRIFIIDNVMLDKYSFGSRPSELQLLT